MPKQTISLEVNPCVASSTLTDLLKIAIGMTEGAEFDLQEMTSILYAASFIAEGLERSAERAMLAKRADIGERPDFSSVEDISYAPLPFMETGERGFNVLTPPRGLTWSDACDAGSEFAARCALLLAAKPADYPEFLREIAARLSLDESADKSQLGFAVGFYYFLSMYLSDAATVVDPWTFWAEHKAEIEATNAEGGAK